MSLKCEEQHCGVEDIWSYSKNVTCPALVIRGQFVDLSEYEVAAALIGPALLEAAVMKTEISPTGNRSKAELAAPRGCYRCKGTDRWCAIAACNKEQWQALCHVLGSPRWIEDQRFTTLSGRIKYARQLDELIEQKTANRAAPELGQLLQSAGLPAAAVQETEDLANDPQLLARNFFVHLPHPALGDTVSDGSPLKLRRTAVQNWKAAPALGEDNRYVYLDLLGLIEAEFLSYVREKIIA